MDKARLALALLLALFPAMAMASSGESASARFLALHNRERESLGIAPLHWNPALAAEARQWAESLAQRRAFEHSRNRNGQGENLWMGTAGYFAPEDMIGGFIDERRDFRPGVFPQVSRTGNWRDVGHYTQLVWPATREVGCALARGGGNDVLVCRYWPSGNVVGQRVP